VPRKNRLVAAQPDLAIRKALAGINVSTAALEVVAIDLGLRSNATYKHKRHRENTTPKNKNPIHCPAPR
jgi:hypothetical protein